MAGFGFISMNVKEFFLDKERVEQLAGKQTASFLNRVGGNIRTIARRSMRRKKKGVSKPGEPPFAHTGLLRDFLFYAYDQSNNSVVVGPLRFNQKNLLVINKGRSTLMSKGVVPAVLEFGGTYGKREILEPDGTWKYLPWGYKLKDRIVPVWKATPPEKAASTGKKTIHAASGRAINFYVIPADKREQRVRWVKIAARPYMGPALRKSTTEYAKLWGASAFSAYKQQAA